MNNPTSILGETANPRKRRVCVLALVLMILAAGVGGVPSSAALAQESPPMDATDANTAEVEAAPTETIAPTTATVSPEPNADRWSTVTMRARYKTH
jgi:disulfide bond formation protein DsbB